MLKAALRPTSQAVKTELLENYKLKLKNEKPKTLEGLIAAQKKASFTPMRTNFGAVPKAPILIEALASLHADTAYHPEANVPKPADPWAAAAAYAAHKDTAINPTPGQPLAKRRAPSAEAASTPPKAGIRWAEVEADIRLFEKDSIIS